MEKDIVVVVARQLKDAQENLAVTLQNVHHAEEALKSMQYLQELAEERLGDIEDIHDIITND